MQVMETETAFNVRAAHMIAEASAIGGHPDIDPSKSSAFVKTLLDGLVEAIPYYGASEEGSSLQRERNAAVARYKDMVKRAMKDKSVEIKADEKKIVPTFIGDLKKNV